MKMEALLLSFSNMSTKNINEAGRRHVQNKKMGSLHDFKLWKSLLQDIVRCCKMLKVWEINPTKQINRRKVR